MGGKDMKATRVTRRRFLGDCLFAGGALLAAALWGGCSQDPRSRTGDAARTPTPSPYPSDHAQAVPAYGVFPTETERPPRPAPVMARYAVFVPERNKKGRLDK